MADDTITPGAPEPGSLAEALAGGTPPTPDPTPDPTPAPDPTPDPAPAGDEPKHPIGTMEDALKVIADLRAENAKARTTAKEQAAEQARTELIEKLTASLGLTPDTDTPPSPEEATARLAAEVEQERATARTAALELAVYKQAIKAGANADRLLDSRSFTATITALDPADTQAIADAVQNAVDSMPELRQVQATGPTRTDHAPGGPDSATPLNVSDAVATYYQR